MPDRSAGTPTRSALTKLTMYAVSDKPRVWARDRHESRTVRGRSSTTRTRSRRWEYAAHKPICQAPDQIGAERNTMLEYQYSYFIQKGYKKKGKWNLSYFTIHSKEPLKTGTTYEHGSYRTRINELVCIHDAETINNEYTGNFTLLYKNSWESLQKPISPKNTIWHELPAAITRASELNLGELTLQLLRISHELGIDIAPSTNFKL